MDLNRKRQKKNIVEGNASSSMPSGMKGLLNDVKNKKNEILPKIEAENNTEKIATSSDDTKFVLSKNRMNIKLQKEFIDKIVTSSIHLVENKPVYTPIYVDDKVKRQLELIRNMIPGRKITLSALSTAILSDFIGNNRDFILELLNDNSD